VAERPRDLVAIEEVEITLHRFAVIILTIGIYDGTLSST
jgi:hypothetical protein